MQEKNSMKERKKGKEKKNRKGGDTNRSREVDGGVIYNITMSECERDRYSVKIKLRIRGKQEKGEGNGMGGKVRIFNEN